MKFKNYLKKNEEKIRKTIIGILFLCMLSISTYLSFNTSPTSDEFTFVVAGYSYWKTFDFRMNTEQPPLLKMINTIPLLFMDIKLPLKHESWKKAKLFENDGFYKQFTFNANKDKKEIMLYSTRIMNSVLSLILAALILLWSTQMFGKWAGVIALMIYSFEPTITGFSSLFMMDTGLALFVTIALYCLWKFLNKPTATTLIFAAITFGLAQLTKYTAIMLYGIYPAIMLSYLIAGKLKTPKTFVGRKILFITASYVGIAIVGLLCINLIYGFKGTLQTAQQMFDADDNIDKTVYSPEKMFSNKYTKFIAEKIPLPIPYPYVKGLGYVIVEAKSPRTTYLFGKTSDNGFWYYYALSFLVKTPISILLILTAAIIYFAISKNKLENDLILIIPTIIYVFLFSINQKQIGIRHIIQVYPLIIIFASRVANVSILNKKSGKTCLSILAILLILHTTSAFPDYISYTNEIFGLNQAYLYFGDSNINLGQDMPRMIEFIKHHPETKAASTQDILENYVQYNKLKDCEKGLTIIDATNLNTNKEYSWLKCKTPVKKIGRTVLVYNITKC